MKMQGHLYSTHTGIPSNFLFDAAQTAIERGTVEHHTDMRKVPPVKQSVDDRIRLESFIKSLLLCLEFVRDW